MDQTSSVVVALAIIVAAAHIMGYLFTCIRQPKFAGEILAGVLIGPFIPGQFSQEMSGRFLGEAGELAKSTQLVMGFVYWLGLLLLMFISGSEVRRVLGRENRRPTAWLLGIGTSLPFFTAIVVGFFLPPDWLAGPRGKGTPVLLVLAIAVAVTSIPVLSRIFCDLKILQTRFASIILSVALLEDIALWAALAIATALGTSTGAIESLTKQVSEHVGMTLGFMAAGLFVMPSLLRQFHVARWNVIRPASPTGYSVVILLTYAAIAAALDVNLVFAAFLAGFGLVGGMSGSQRTRFAEPLEAIQKVATGFFIPAYFVLVGTRLQFGSEFSVGILVTFLVGSSILRFSSIALAARFAGFRGIEIVNLAVVSNARGGPGIVLASVAYEAGIINDAFFTVLVITAVLTSQFAGTWLGMVLRRGWTLLREDMPDLHCSGESTALAEVLPAPVLYNRC